MTSLLPVPQEDAIREDYLRGATLYELSKLYRMPRFQLAHILGDAATQQHTVSKMQSLRLRAVEYRMRAFDLAEDALEDLAELRKVTADEHLRRKIDNDFIRVAGLEPRKVIQVNQTGDFSIDRETREWFDSVLSEAGVDPATVVDAEIENP